MFAVNHTTPLKSNIAGDQRLRPISGAGGNGSHRSKTYVRLNRRGGSVRAAISKGDKAVGSSVPVQRKDANGSLISSSSSLSSSLSPVGGTEVRAVVTIRKKMKEKLTEKVEDQWEFFINGIGQGIQIQLISEELDPGNLLFFNHFFSKIKIIIYVSLLLLRIFFCLCLKKKKKKKKKKKSRTNFRTLNFYYLHGKMFDFNGFFFFLIVF